MDDSFGYCYLFLDLPECSYHYLVAQNSVFGFIKRKEKESVEALDEEEEAEQPEFTNPQPQTVEFSVKKTFKQDIPAQQPAMEVAPPVHDNFMVEEPAPVQKMLDMTFSKTVDDVMVSPPTPEVRLLRLQHL